MKSVIIIPARFKSSRFPGKPLVKLLGKPMILWVAELSARAVGQDQVFVATEDARIADAVQSGGFQAVLTSDNALTGTDRVAEAARQIQADIYINVQGDEPLLDPFDILRIRDAKIQSMGLVVNGYCKLAPSEDPNNINIPKVITTEAGRLVYISRKALPGHKEDKNAPEFYWKQVCIYAFSHEELEWFEGFGRKSELEQVEDIEILRFLESESQILMIETLSHSIAVDIPEDVNPVERALNNSI